MEGNQIYQSVVETSFFDEEAFLRALEKCDQETFSFRFVMLDLLYQKIKTERELKSVFQITHYDTTFLSERNAIGLYDTKLSLIISKIINVLSEFYFGSDDKTIAIKAFELAHERYHSARDYTYSNSPQILGEFIFDIIKVKEDQSVYDPFCGFGGFLVEAHKKNDTLKLIGGDIGIHNAIFAQKRLEIHGIDPKEIVAEDFFQREKNNIEYDILVTDPPFGVSLVSLDIKHFQTQNSNRFEFIALEKCFENLKENGQLAIVLPDNILVPQMRQKDGIYKDNFAEVRQFFQNQAEINLIVSLPETTYYNLGSTVKCSIIFFTKKKNRNPTPYQVYLAANKFGSKGVSEKLIKAFLDEIAVQYNNKTLPSVSSEALNSWSADRLWAFENDLFNDNLQKIKIKDIVKITNKEKIKLTENNRYNQVRIGRNQKIELLENNQKISTNQVFTLVQKGCVVVLSVGLMNGSIAVFDGNIENAIVSSHFFVLELDNRKVLGEYLVALFNQEKMKEYVLNISNKGSMPRITLLSLLEIEIPLLPLVEQQKFVDNALKIKELEQAIKNVQDENLSKINQLFNSK